jgi:CRISPR/Cas system-associated exonuclease Cas4 (RecB family)
MNIGAWLAWSAVDAFAVLVVALVLRRRRGAMRKTAELASRPRALRNASLVYMEEQFRILAPIPLIARVDRAYRAADGELVLVELKTRSSDRAYATDVIQLSVQKMAIEGQIRQRVSARGFVTVQASDGTAATRSHQVALMETLPVIALFRRREGIVSGRITPRYADSPSACEGCAFRARCDRPRS